MTSGDIEPCRTNCRLDEIHIKKIYYIVTVCVCVCGGGSLPRCPELAYDNLTLLETGTSPVEM